MSSLYCANLHTEKVNIRKRISLDLRVTTLLPCSDRGAADATDTMATPYRQEAWLATRKDV